MTEREIVFKTMEILIDERKKCDIGAKFWQKVFVQERIDRIAAAIGVDEKDKEIVILTLALADADFGAQKAGGDWPVWKHKETGKIVTDYTQEKENWNKIAEFNTAIHDLCTLGEEYKKLEMPERFDKYMNEWWDAVAEGYADSIEEIKEREEGLESKEDVKHV